jgi:hypothetical protein
MMGCIDFTVRKTYWSESPMNARHTIIYLVGTMTVIATAGPDVIVGDIPNAANYGSVGTIHAYSIATTACNIGDAELDWFANTNRHPVIAQNLYRLADGRFEQIGMSWVRHGILALQTNLCEDCIPAAGGGTRLGVGCSNPNSAGVNGSQGILGPRSEINAATGAFPYPFTSIGLNGDAVFKRLQVLEADLAAPDSRFFFEGHYVTPDDAATGNGANNASWREVQFFGGNFSPSMVDATRREEPAMFAWAEADADVMLDFVDVPNDGRFWIASRAYDNGDGTWDYEYAVHNINSHRSADGFSVPIGTASAAEFGFHDVPYHSGEPYDGTEWPGTAAAGSATWSTDPFSANPDANALRWGTMYNFRFTSDAPPVQGEAVISLFRPGAPGQVTVLAWIPEGGQCTADFNGDGELNFFDVQDFLEAFAAGDASADLTNDGVFDFFDVAAFLDAFSAGCP